MGNTSSTSGTGKLQLNDLPSILEKLTLVQDKWFEIGQHIGLPVQSLNSLKEQHKNNSKECLRDMLIRWLKSGNASLEVLKQALKDKNLHKDVADEFSNDVQREIDRELGEGNLTDWVNIGEELDSLPSTSSLLKSDKGPSLSTASKYSSTVKSAQASAGALGKEGFVASHKVKEEPSEITRRALGGKESAEKSPGRKSMAKKPDTTPLNQDEPTSFDRNMFVTNQPDEVFCVTCKRVPRKPQRTKCCKLIYCKPCAMKLLPLCPLHNVNQTYSLDSELNKRIYWLTVKCSNLCGWKGTVPKVGEHLKKCLLSRGSTLQPSIVTPDPASLMKEPDPPVKQGPRIITVGEALNLNAILNRAALSSVYSPGTGTSTQQTKATETMKLQTTAAITHGTQKSQAETVTLQGTAMQKLLTMTPSTQKPGTQKPGTQKPGTQKPSTQNPSMQNPSMQKLPTKKPTTQKPSAQKLALTSVTTSDYSTQPKATATVTHKVQSKKPNTQKPNAHKLALPTTAPSTQPTKTAITPTGTAMQKLPAKTVTTKGIEQQLPITGASQSSASRVGSDVNQQLRDHNVMKQLLNLTTTANTGTPTEQQQRELDIRKQILNLASAAAAATAKGSPALQPKSSPTNTPPTTTIVISKADIERALNRAAAANKLEKSASIIISKSDVDRVMKSQKGPPNITDKFQVKSDPTQTVQQPPKVPTTTVVPVQTEQIQLLRKKLKDITPPKEKPKASTFTSSTSKTTTQATVKQSASPATVYNPKQIKKEPKTPVALNRPQQIKKESTTPVASNQSKVAKKNTLPQSTAKQVETKMQSAAIPQAVSASAGVKLVTAKPTSLATSGLVTAKPLSPTTSLATSGLVTAKPLSPMATAKQLSPTALAQTILKTLAPGVDASKSGGTVETSGKGNLTISGSVLNIGSLALPEAINLLAMLTNSKKKEGDASRSAAAPATSKSSGVTPTSVVPALSAVKKASTGNQSPSAAPTTPTETTPVAVEDTNVTNNKAGKKRKRDKVVEEGPKAKAGRLEEEGPSTYRVDDFVRAQPDTKKCKKCHLIPTVPQRTKCCRTLYCVSCSKETPTCDTCEKSDGYTTDYKMKDRLKGLMSWCLHKDQGCDWTGHFRNRAEHLEECSKSKVACEYSSLGCTEMVTKESMEVHITEQRDHHLDLAVKTVANMKCEMRENKSKECPLKAEMKPNTPPLILVVSPITRQDTWTSPAFYSHQLGYRMRLQVKIDENEGALMVRVITETGENDKLLGWPASGKITIKLLNQNNDSDHYISSASFMLSKTDSSGWIKFVAVTSLLFPSKDVKYYVDERLYFRVMEISFDAVKTWLME